MTGEKEIKILWAVLLSFLVIVTIVGALTASYVGILKDKVSYYERVITDLGIEEFIDYPDLFYDEEMREQTKVHLCMWSIDETIACHNELDEMESRLQEIKDDFGIIECPQDGYELCR